MNHGPLGEHSTQSLPTHDYDDDDTYVHDLLAFITTSALFQTLVSSVHILDFFTSNPDLYENTIPQDWRDWFDLHDQDAIVDFLLRSQQTALKTCETSNPMPAGPPESLTAYLSTIKRLSLDRAFRPSGVEASVSRQLSVGMTAKKTHEVTHTAAYIQSLTSRLAEAGATITHLVDFGAGQGYLGRFLASSPFKRNVIAVESRDGNVGVAKALDVMVKLAPKSGIRRNKKVYRGERAEAKREGRSVSPAWRATRVGAASENQGTEVEAASSEDKGTEVNGCSGGSGHASVGTAVEGRGSVQHVAHKLADGDLGDIISGLRKGVCLSDSTPQPGTPPSHYDTCPSNPSLQHHPPVFESSTDTAHQASPSTPSDDDHHPRPRHHSTSQPANPSRKPALLVTSLHSCGNLSHHALRSLTLNPAVRAVAIIGCCYNLLTERLTAPTWKSEYLRPPPSTPSSTTSVSTRTSKSTSTSTPNPDPNPTSPNPTSDAHTHGDPHGFPMSTRLLSYLYPTDTPTNKHSDKGITFNITARMLSVQSPSNWTTPAARSFFTRHFFRALLQHVFLDFGVVGPPTHEGKREEEREGEVPPVSPAGGGGSSQPIIVGKLHKSAYGDFPTYARAAATRLLSQTQPPLSTSRSTKLASITDAALGAYGEQFEQRRKDIAITWTLMALSAVLVESCIVVDRWLWLREQREVQRAWVQSVFSEGVSPRNMVVVGIKKP